MTSRDRSERPKLPTNRVRGLLQVTGFGFVGVYLFLRARFYDHSDALLIAMLGGLASGLLAACYYWEARFLWHDFGGSGLSRSRRRQVAEFIVSVFVVVAAVTCLVLIVRQQGKS